MIIGTAGHIDHGKTTLVKALTGVDTDRLEEEKRRGISIDLGFAPFFLPSGLEAAIVDVPGHERFIKNMAAGASGIDLLLLAVAADDGIMAQTKEHLAVAELLGVRAAIGVVTKTDAVSRDRAVEVEGQVRELFAGCRLEGSPIIKVSASKKLGLESLIQAIEQQAAKVAPRDLDLPARLPIDRSFIVPGAGRVVTGTLWSGVLTTGSPLEILPSGETCRPRRIEVHGNRVTKALAGQRVAVNIVLSGKTPQRGDMLLPPAAFSLVHELIARIEMVPQAPRALDRRVRLRLHHGTKEISARAVPMGRSEIGPGETGYARLSLSEPIVAAFRDRFVLRAFTPPTTIGGGTVLKTGRRHSQVVADLEELEVLAIGDDRAVVLRLLENAAMPLTVDDVAFEAGLGEKKTEAVLEDLAPDKVVKLQAWQRTYYMAIDLLAADAALLIKALKDVHRSEPYQFGPDKESVRASLWPELSSSQADILFEYFMSAGLIAARENRLALAEAEAGGDPAAAKRRDLLALLAGFSPPDFKSLVDRMGLDIKDVKALLAQLESAGLVAAVSADLYFSAKALDEANDVLSEYLLNVGEITVAKFKELLGTTRKYAVPLLEYFDRHKVTRRVGDIRVLFDPVVEE